VELKKACSTIARAARSNETFYHCTTDDDDDDTIEIPGTEILGRIFTYALARLVHEISKKSVYQTILMCFIGM
jgi:hypothetical protein